MFGEVKKLPIKGKCPLPMPEDLKAPFEWEEAVARCFCAGCCNVAEINDNLAKKLMRKIGELMPKSFSGKYFVVDRCILCADDFETPKLEEIL